MERCREAAEARLLKQSLSRANKSKQTHRLMLFSVQGVQGAGVLQKICFDL